MKHIHLALVSLIMGTVFFSSCNEEEYSLGELPGAIEITVLQDPDTSNYVTFSSATEGFIYNWKFGNGSIASGKTVEYAYPISGEFTVVLSVHTAGGFATDSVIVQIDKDLPVNSPIPDLLTGGIDNINGKTWVIDSTLLGHLACGPIETDVDSWWQAPGLDKSGVGYYDDEFTFILNQFSFIQETHGDAFILSDAETPNFTGVQLNQGFKADFTAPNNLTWELVRDGGRDYLTIYGGGFIGCFSGVYTFEIVSITEDELLIRFLEPSNATIAWYQRFILKE